MSGHSHAKTVMHKKTADAAKRGKVFSKFSRLITLAVKEKGGNPETNSSLRMVIDRAKTFNMPLDNIEKAIKKGTGELVGEKLEEFSFEAYGPGGSAVIIEGITDNKNRASGEIKQAVGQHNGKIVGEGAIKWMFERKGVILIENVENKESMEATAIESGADDIEWDDNNLVIYTKPEDLETSRKIIEEKGVKISSISLDWVAKEKISLDEKSKESYQKLYEDLDELDSVQEVYSNIAE